MNEKEALKILGDRANQPPEAVKEAAQIVLAARRAKDPIYQVKLTPTQEAFIASRTRYKLLSSVNRGGKTSAISFKLARTARRIDPVWSVPKGVNGIYCIFAPRRDQIVDPWYKKLCVGSEFKGGPWENEPLIPEREIKKVYYTHGGGKPTPKVIELVNGHSIWCGVSGDKHAWEGLEGKGMVLGIALDESAGTQQLIDECMVRLLDAHSHPVVKAACGGGWLDWGATETKVNDAFSAFRAKAQDDQCNDFAEFVIPPDENPAIDPSERDKYKQVLSDDVYATRMSGEGGALNSLLIYPQWDDAIHWCEDPYEVQDDDTLYIGWDPGVNVSGHVYIAYRKDAPFVGHVFAAKELKRATLAHEALVMKSTVLGRRVEWLAYDQAARKIEKTSGSSAIWNLKVELQKIGLPLHAGTFKGRSNYGDAIPVVRQLLTNQRLILHKGSEILRSQFKSYRFTAMGGELKEDNILRGNDHAVDSAKYILTTGPHWKERPRNYARMRPDGGEIQFTPDPKTLSDEDMNIREQMRVSKLYAMGKLPGW